MKVIGRPRLLEFIQLHDEARGALQSWLREVEVANWDSAHEIQNRYPHAQLLPRDVVVFVVAGHHCRVKVQVNFAARILLVLELSACDSQQLSFPLPLESGTPGRRSIQLPGGRHEH